MTDIASLPAASAAADADLIPATQGSTGPGTGTTRVVTPQQILARPVLASGGTTALTVAQRAGWRLTPQDFGAKGNGSTDDTTALNAWLAAVVSTGARGFAPAATYIHTGLTLDCSTAALGVVIEGAHAGQTIFKSKSGSTNDALTIKAGQNYGMMSRPRICDLTIDCNSTARDGIHFTDLANNGSYPQAADLRDLTVKFPTRDCLYVGTNNNAGETYNLWLAHPGRNCITINAGDWRINGEFYGAATVGVSVSNVSNSATTPGLVRVTTSTPHGLSTGATLNVWGTSGSTCAVGVWTNVTVIDASNIDLPGSTYAAGYTSGGTVLPVFTITGAADNGSGLIRITTSQAHGYSTGQQVFIRDVVGLYNANGGWFVTVIDSTHFDLQSSQSGATYTSGGTVRAAAFGVNVLAPAANFFTDCTLYNNLIAVNITSNSGNVTKFLGGEANANTLGAFVIQTYGLATPHVINGMALSNNAFVSAAAPDIYACNAGALELVGNQFVLSTAPVSYLVESVNTVLHHNWAGNGFRDDGGSQPWATGIVSDFTAGIPGNRFGVVGGYFNNCGGTATTVFGYKNAGTGQGSFVVGNYGNDHGRRGVFAGRNLFSAVGDNDDIISIPLNAVTTGTTPTQLTSDGNSAGSSNVANCHKTYGTTLYSPATVVAQIRGTTNRAVWVLPPIVLTQDANAASTAIVSGTGLLTPGAQTATYATSGMSGVALSITADTTHGGLNITATGLASTTIDWAFSARGVEIA